MQQGKERGELARAAYPAAARLRTPALDHASLHRCPMVFLLPFLSPSHSQTTTTFISKIKSQPYLFSGLMLLVRLANLEATFKLFIGNLPPDPTVEMLQVNSQRIITNEFVINQSINNR